MRASYTYRAQLERIIDGDTFALRIDLGFGVWVYETIRLARINAAEKTGDQADRGQAAEAFCHRWFACNHDFTIRTQKNLRGQNTQEKYGRYLAEIDGIFAGFGTNLADELVVRELATLWEGQT